MHYSKKSSDPNTCVLCILNIGSEQKGKASITLGWEERRKGESYASNTSFYFLFDSIHTQTTSFLAFFFSIGKKGKYGLAYATF